MGYNCNPSNRWMYLLNASRISLMRMNSSAEWERDDCPGPSFIEGKGIRAWSERVGDPKGFIPISTQRSTKGCSTLMADDDRWNERAFIWLFMCSLRMSKTSLFL